jgi:ribosome biogenesis GTPase
MKPLVGDDVEISSLEEVGQKGSITGILPRKNALIRPACANVDQAVVVFALSYPKPNLNLLDRFLLMMQTQDVSVVICFNKSDQGASQEISDIVSQYDKSGAKVIVTSTVTGEGIDGLKDCLLGKTTVLAGPSGVGKSSVMNLLYPKAQMETGLISEKIKRGRHTTRHTELFDIAKDTYIMDTPGFTSLQLPPMEKEELAGWYPEFEPYRDGCRFQGCTHIHEPDCRVMEALERGEISVTRYDNYRQFYQEISELKKY